MASDYYQVLGVARGASEKDIKRAYRRLARQYHPDVNRHDEAAEERFKEVQEAYRVLTDPKLREQYDRFGSIADPAGGGPGFEGFPFGNGGRGFRFTTNDIELGEGGLGDLFGGLFGGRRRAAARRGRDVEATVSVTLEEVDRGADRDLTVTIEDLCPTCGGSGQAADGPCRGCGGVGVRRHTEPVRGLKIPPGVVHGEVIRARGKGGAGAGGGAAGDLLVTVQVRPHAYFERAGADLIAEVPITLAEAALGGQVQVPTLWETKPLRLPPGTQGGQRFRIKGFGLPDRKTGQRGSLVVRVKVVVPSDLKPDERRMIEALSARAGDPRAELWRPRSGA